ncbi:MAG TPA: hypothetical protein ENK91_02325 [Bacteroidetes bacterium]|nr:hypothetical protein [Bacteroidota bacterium]
MNNHRFYPFLSGFIFILFFSISNFSCIDKCKDKICENGYCIKGDCFCEDGYSGKNCEIKESDKFAGIWTGLIKCDFLEQAVKTTISNNFLNPRQINLQIDNFSNNMLLRAHILKDSIFIENQFVESVDSYINNGQIYFDTILNLIYPTSGVISNDTILEFDLKIKGDDLLECLAHLKKN